MKKKQLTDSQRAATLDDLKKRVKELVDDIPAFADECLQRIIDSEHADIVGDHFDEAPYTVPKAFIAALARELERQHKPPFPGTLRVRHARRVGNYYKHM